MLTHFNLLSLNDMLSPFFSFYVFLLLFYFLFRFLTMSNDDLFDWFSSSSFEAIDTVLIVLVNDFKTHFWPWTPATDLTKHQGMLVRYCSAAWYSHTWSPFWTCYLKLEKQILSSIFPILFVTCFFPSQMVTIRFLTESQLTCY